MAAESARKIDLLVSEISNCINCSFRPELSPGQVLREQLISGLFYFEPDRIRLHLTNGQGDWTGPFGGEIEERIKAALNRNSPWQPGDINVRNFLWANQHCLIPKDFTRFQTIVFAGTLIDVSGCAAWPVLRRRKSEEDEEFYWEKSIVFLYNRFFNSDQFLLIALT